MDCIFCKIVGEEIPSTKVYEDEHVFGFYDIHPMAKVHVILIPKQHIASAASITAEHEAVIGHIFAVAAQLSVQLGLTEGFRIVTNCGRHGCQSINHLHFHLLGGAQLLEKIC